MKRFKSKVDEILDSKTTRKKFLQALGFGALSIPLMSPTVAAQFFIRQTDGNLINIDDIGSANPEGPTGAIQYNNEGELAGTSNLHWDNTETRLGVGTNTPAATLDVNGSIILATGTSINQFTTDGTLTENSDNNVPTEQAVKTYVDTEIGSIGAGPSGSGSAGQITYWTGTDSQSGSNNLYWDTTNNRLGIGTNSPGAKLEILGSSQFTLDSGNTSGGLFVRDDSGSASGDFGGHIYLSQGRGSSNAGVAIAAVHDGGAWTNDRYELAFFTKPGAAIADPLVEQMRIDKDGNVGIGTDEPNTQLHLGSSTSGNNIISLGSPTGSGGPHGIDFLESSDGSVGLSLYYRTSPQSLFIEDQAGNQHVTIEQTGNVGIGTNPSTALDVSGVITATGGNSSNWNTAYGWGDHSTAGYVPESRTISSGDGLSGGGNLSANRTLAVDSSVSRLVTINGEDLLDLRSTATFFDSTSRTRTYKDLTFGNSSSSGAASPISIETGINGANNMFWIEIDIYEYAGARGVHKLICKGYNRSSDVVNTRVLYHGKANSPSITYGKDNSTGNLIIKFSTENGAFNYPYVHVKKAMISHSTMNNNYGTGWSVTFGDIASTYTTTPAIDTTWTSDDFTSTNISNWDTAYTERGSQIAGTGLTWSSNNLNVDSSVVRTSGNQTIGGIKTFSSQLQANNGVRVQGSTQHGYNGIRSTTSNSGHLMLDSNGGNLYLNWEDNGGVYVGGGGNVTVELADGSGSVGIGVNRSPSYKLDVNGTIRASGDVIANSDVRLKTNIQEIPDALNKIKQIRGVTYNRKDLEGNPRQAGVIAQEIEKILPEVVHTADDKDKTKSVAYANMISLLIQAIKEQEHNHHQEIMLLREEIKAIK